jgi:hypothetical protein
MRHFEVHSGEIALPGDGKDDPARLLDVSWKGRPVTGIRQSWRRVYVYPVLTPAGVAVTEGRPSSDHPFHQSITVGNDYVFTYRRSDAGRVEDPGMCFYTDMEDMRGRGEGRIIATTHNECTELARDHLEIIVRTQWQGPEEGYAPKFRRVVAEEIRTISVHPGERANVIDVRSQLRPTNWDLRIGPSRHGYFTVRVADHLRVVDPAGAPAGGRLVDAEGRRDDEVCWQHADWIDFYGADADGRTAGLAVFQAASIGNAAWYAGTYGSVRVNPFRKDATFVHRGEALDLGIRVVAHDGDPAEAGVAKLYEAFREEVGS